MLDFCAREYNPASREADYKRFADTLQFNAANIQVPADTGGLKEIKYFSEAIK